MDNQLYNSKGQTVNARSNDSGITLVNNLGAKYQEAVLSSNVFSVCNQSGITTQAGLSATSPALTLYNPTGSGINAVILYAGCTNSVAFAAASVIWLGANINIAAAAAVTGTPTTAHSCGMLGNAKNPTIKPFLAATLPTAPIAIATLGVGLTGAITTTPQIPIIGRWFDGTLILAPGSALSFQTSTASGTSGFFGEFVWFETDI